MVDRLLRRQGTTFEGSLPLMPQLKENIRSITFDSGLSRPMSVWDPGRPFSNAVPAWAVV